MNSVVLVGRMASDPIIDLTKNDKLFCAFTIAVRRKYKNADGKYDADFIRCLAWENKASLVSDHIHKGDLFGVSGSLGSSSYDDSDGKKVYRTTLIVENIDFLSNKRHDVEYWSPPVQNKNEKREVAAKDNIDVNDLIPPPPVPNYDTSLPFDL